MIYEFAAKIKNVKNDGMLNDESVAKSLSEISKKFEKPLEVKVMFLFGNSDCALLIKSQASVSTMPMFHDKERDDAIAVFKQYLEELAIVFNGEISKTDGFYNNTKTYSRLYS
jgi:acetone carboxylase gamma subunit